LKGTGNGDFTVYSTGESGLFLDGEIRDFKIFSHKQNDLLVVSKNNSTVDFYQY
jgi:hypothetical protein